MNSPVQMGEGALARLGGKNYQMTAGFNTEVINKDSRAKHSPASSVAELSEPHQTS
jgi:hypothetical protein